VRKDLLATFHRMFSHEAFAQLDWVVIETTGMADPAPLIQSLYMDPECQARLRLDSVLTVVDCKHLPVHLRTPPAPKPAPEGAVDEGNPLSGLKSVFRITPASTAATDKSPLPEAVLQISFADRVLLNKTDLVSEAELGALVQSVQKINPTAKLIACQNSNVPLEELLNIRAFDPLQNKALVAEDSIAAMKEATPAGLIQVDADGKILKKTVQLGRGRNKKLQLSAAGEKLRSKHTVNTVSLVTEQPLDLDLFNEWISKLLADKGTDIYRMKGTVLPTTLTLVCAAIMRVLLPSARDTVHGRV
jgi:G3E family GTPase